jgi:hypothetical protein
MAATATARADSAPMAAPPQSDVSISPDKPVVSAAYATFVAGGAGGGLAGFASASVEKGPFVVSLRMAGMSELNILGPTPTENVTDFGALVGGVARGEYVSLSAEVGISMVDSVKRGKLLSDGGDCIICAGTYEAVGKTGVGVPFAVTLTLHGAHGAGDLSVFGNINHAYSYVGVGVGFSVGMLR